MEVFIFFGIFILFGAIFLLLLQKRNQKRNYIVLNEIENDILFSTKVRYWMSYGMNLTYSISRCNIYLTNDAIIVMDNFAIDLPAIFSKGKRYNRKGIGLKNFMKMCLFKKPRPSSFHRCKVNNNKNKQNGN